MCPSTWLRLYLYPASNGYRNVQRRPPFYAELRSTDALRMCVSALSFTS